MSCPTSSLPGDIRDLLVTFCLWEAFKGFDGHAEPSYALPVVKPCYREAHSMLQTGLEVARNAEITTSDPDWDLYFEGDDPDALSFTLYDRFTPHGVGALDAFTLQPTSINTILGPFGPDPWLVVVSF